MPNREVRISFDLARAEALLLLRLLRRVDFGDVFEEHEEAPEAASVFQNASVKVRMALLRAGVVDDDPTTESSLSASFEALATSDELMRRLNEDLDQDRVIVWGERIAAALASKTSVEVASLNLDTKTMSEWAEWLFEARASLAARQGLVGCGIARLYWLVEERERRKHAPASEPSA
jgi:hypothetical protein